MYRFSPLMKQNKKAENYVFCFARKKKLLFYIYAVIVKQIFYKRSSNYYLLELTRADATEENSWSTTVCVRTGHV